MSTDARKAAIFVLLHLLHKLVNTNIADKTVLRHSTVFCDKM
jgi:hypothetical protein